jgi:hypothetical protein
MCDAFHSFWNTNGARRRHRRGDTVQPAGGRARQAGSRQPRRQLFFEGQLAGRRFPICRIGLHVYRYQYRVGMACS